MRGEVGGADGSRTHDLSIANAALSQLSYGPDEGGEVYSRRILHATTTRAAELAAIVRHGGDGPMFTRRGRGRQARFGFGRGPARSRCAGRSACTNGRAPHAPDAIRGSCCRAAEHGEYDLVHIPPRQPTCATLSQGSPTPRFHPFTVPASPTLQVDLGYRCRQSCERRHVGAGPNRTGRRAIRAPPHIRHRPPGPCLRPRPRPDARTPPEDMRFPREPCGGSPLGPPRGTADCHPGPLLRLYGGTGKQRRRGARLVRHGRLVARA